MKSYVYLKVKNQDRKIDNHLVQNTDSTKINRPGYNIRVYWMNFWQPTPHVEQNILGKTLIEAFTPQLYASFASKLVNYSRHSESLNNRKNSKIDDFFLR